VRLAQKSTSVQILELPAVATSATVQAALLYHIRVEFSLLVDIEIDSILQSLAINHSRSKTSAKVFLEPCATWAMSITEAITAGTAAVMEDEREDTEVGSDPFDTRAYCTNQLL